MAEELSFQEVEQLLESVINNKQLVHVKGRTGTDKFLVFSHPSSNDILSSRYFRENALIAAAKEELPSRKDVDALIESRGLGHTDKQQISDLEGKIDAQRRLLSLTKLEGRRKPIQDTIQGLSLEVSKLKAKNEHLYSMTQEFKADEESLLFLTWAASHSIDGAKYWPTFQDFEDETDLFLRGNIIEQFAYFNRGTAVSKIRYLARHVLWRIRYTAGLKLGGPLFPQGLHDLTPDQQSLLYWSNYYQSIYEMLPDDQPDDDIIKDDEALDSYMESYFQQREKDRNQGRLKRGSGARGKASEADEVIITPNHPDYLKMSYSEERVKAGKASDVQVVAPNSKRARNMRAARRGR
jgi:hypothetical protein